MEHHHPSVTLVARGTTLVLLGLAALCIGLVWWTEAAQGLLTPSDHYAYPALMLWFGGLALWAWRQPTRVFMVQGLGSLGLGGYFVGTGLYLLQVDGLNAYTAATLLYWLVVTHLVLFVTWPLRMALALSIGVAVLTTAPAVWVELRGGTTREWQQIIWPLYINGALAQVFVIGALFGIAQQVRKLTRLAPSFDGDAPLPAEQTLTVDEIVARRLGDLERARDAAEQASQAKSRFLAVMSHELRTPLHGVLGAADLLRDQRPGDPGYRELVDTVRRGGTHLLRLINDVLDLSRIEAGRLELAQQPFDLMACLAQVMETVRPQAETRGLRCEAMVSNEVPSWARGDAFRLKQVLLNLLGNAVKFTDRGQVTLQVGYDASVQELAVRIEDTGIGIAPAELDRVFEAFHQADAGATRRHAGSGLGLAITRQLVQLMRGSITLTSEPGVGTQVDLRVPLPASAPRDAASSTAPGLGSGQGAAEGGLAGTRVLLVDDDPVNTMIAAQMLQSAAVSVHTASTGRDALNQLSRGGFDLVLMDWRMPDMDGLEATRRLRAGEAGQACQQVPVVGFTANAYAEDREACLAAGMNEVLVKPVGRLRLLRTVQQVLERHGD